MRFPPFRRNILLVSLFLAAVAWFPAHAKDHPFITVAVPPSVERSGLLAYLLPVFEQRTGISVYAVAMDTAQALKSARRGECEVVLVHNGSPELQFLRSSFGSAGREVMYDDFVLVGPEDDPAKIGGTHDAAAALRKIAEAQALFVSSGDTKGDAAEESLWTEAGVHPMARSDPWYVDTGSSMERTLATAASKNGYALTDRGTWLAFRDRWKLKILVEGDERLHNHYAIILVNPEQHPQVKAELGMTFIEWLTSREGQDTIATYKVEGEQLFFPEYVEP